MSQLTAFIPAEFRPDIQGGRLDDTHLSYHLIEDNYPMTEMHVSFIAFGPKKDKVLLNLEHAISDISDALIWYYEDLDQKWSYVQTVDESYFIYRQNANLQLKVHAHNLYIRGCQLERTDKHWLLLGEFFSFVDTWPKRVICAPQKQQTNESKLYQLTHSLLEASQQSAQISIGKSYVVKGQNILARLPGKTSYIVKSLSGIRSIVVDETHFSQWNASGLAALPALFQVKVPGQDLRVHVVNNQLHGKSSQAKTQVDYRYDAHFFTLNDVTTFDEALAQFCLEVTKLEQNTLMGIDFIQTGTQYVVLEANPSPGWSAYHACNGVQNSKFINDLLIELTRIEA